jgi:hypothetical protein
LFQVRGPQLLLLLPPPPLPLLLLLQDLSVDDDAGEEDKPGSGLRNVTQDMQRALGALGTQVRPGKTWSGWHVIWGQNTDDVLA